MPLPVAVAKNEPWSTTSPSTTPPCAVVVEALDWVTRAPIAPLIAPSSWVLAAACTENEASPVWA